MAKDEPEWEALPGYDTIPTHPEEMKTTFNLRVGKSVSLQGSARVTPAGIATAGITAAIVLLAVGGMLRWTRKPPLVRRPLRLR